MKKWLLDHQFEIGLAVLSLIIGSLITWFFSDVYASKKKPTYAISNSILYADARRDLTIFWQNQKIERAYLTYIFIWNDGNQPIDASDIPTSEPICIVPKDPVRILDANFTMSKRPALGLLATPIHLSKSDYVHVSWKQDEALESNEGGVIRILYEAKNPTVFNTQSRVKGTSEGFTKRSSGIALNRSAAWLPIIGGVFYLAMGMYIVVSPDRSARKTWAKTHQFTSADEYVQSLKKSGWSRWISFIAFAIFSLAGFWFIKIGYATLRYPSWASDVINSASMLR